MMRRKVIPEGNAVSHPLHRRTLASTRMVLEELLVLLEDYGPMWYTQDLHDRAAIALRREEKRDRRILRLNHG